MADRIAILMRVPPKAGAKDAFEGRLRALVDRMAEEAFVDAVIHEARPDDEDESGSPPALILYETWSEASEKQFVAHQARKLYRADFEEQAGVLLRKPREATFLVPVYENTSGRR